MNDQIILHLWDTHVAYETSPNRPKQPPLDDKDKLAFARAVLAAAMNWQPIETAPKDGEEVILRHGSRVGSACWVEWPATYEPDGCLIDEGGESWSIGHDGDSWDDEKAPTHWMPLPEPPKEE
jgi:hypothetical protein